MKAVFSWIGERLKEKTTWVSMIGFVALAGLQFSPEQSEAIVTAGVALTSVILIFVREPK